MLSMLSHLFIRCRFIIYIYIYAYTRDTLQHVLWMLHLYPTRDATQLYVDHFICKTLARGTIRYGILMRVLVCILHNLL